MSYYLDIAYEELQNFNFVQSDQEDSAEFSMICPNLLELDLDDSYSVSNAAAVSTITTCYFLCYFMKFVLVNEGQQHLFNFLMQFAVHCKLAERNNELPPKPFKIFLSGGAAIKNEF